MLWLPSLARSFVSSFLSFLSLLVYWLFGWARRLEKEGCSKSWQCIVMHAPQVVFRPQPCTVLFWD